MITALLDENHKGFLPPALRNGTFLKWLKRTHAWLGLWGRRSASCSASPASC